MKNSALWESANIMRGYMRADEIKDYLLPLVYLKYANQENIWNKCASISLQKGDVITELKNFLKNNKADLGWLNLDSEKIGKNEQERNELLSKIILAIDQAASDIIEKKDVLGDAYEYLIAQFAAEAGKRAGEFYTPQSVASLLSEIILTNKPSNEIKTILDFACGSGSLLLNLADKIRKQGGKIERIYGQEKNFTTYNLAKMNMFMRDFHRESQIFNGDTLLNEWNIFNGSPIGLDLFSIAKESTKVDAIVSNPPFSLKWEPHKTITQDFRFVGFPVPPASKADYAFVLHGLSALKEDGVMALILPLGVLFRGNAEGEIRAMLLKKNLIDSVILLSDKLFFYTDIPVCIIVIKKQRTEKDVFIINAQHICEKQKNKNDITQEHIAEIVSIYKKRENIKGIAKKVSVEDIKANDYNLNVTRYVTQELQEEEIDFLDLAQKLAEVDSRIDKSKNELNAFLAELNLPLIV